MSAPMIFPFRRVALLALAAALVSSCSNDGATPTDPVNDIVVIDVVGPPTSLIAGETYSLAATPRNASGGLPGSVILTWKSSNEAVATVVDGIVTARSVGTADITAQAQGKTGTTKITVVATERLVSEDKLTGGGMLGFSSSRNGGELDVYLMNSAGVQRITTSPDHDQFDGWSPDGARVAILRFPVNTDLVTSHIANVDGTSDVLVSEGIVNWAPDWQHRGTVAGGLLTLSNADGSGAHPIGSTGAAAFGPFWSPDGKKIAFGYAASAGQLPDIYVANVDGTGLVNVTNTPLIDEEFASWSPDGTRLAFIGENQNIGKGSSVYVVGANGSGLAQLTNSPVTRGDYEPQWSPDGNLISYTTYFGNSYGLFVTRPAGGPPVRLSPTTMIAGFGHWSPDGTRLAFTAIAEGSSRQNIFVITLDRRTMTQLTRNTADNLGPFWRPN
jgi:Tol biopolymer transport system component